MSNKLAIISIIIGGIIIIAVGIIVTLNVRTTPIKTLEPINAWVYVGIDLLIGSIIGVILFLPTGKGGKANEKERKQK